MRQAKPIKWAVFDIGGVLLTQGVEDYDREVFDLMGTDGYPQFYRDFFPALQRGEIDEAEFWAKAAGHPVSIEALGAAWKRHFRPIQGMIDLARDLRRRGVKTAILSNTEMSHVARMRGMDILSGFEPKGFSCEMGLIKPDAAAYRWALDRLETPPEQVAFIDDRRENIDAALRLGIMGVLFRGDVQEVRERLFALAGLHEGPDGGPDDGAPGPDADGKGGC